VRWSGKNASTIGGVNSWYWHLAVASVLSLFCGAGRPPVMEGNQLA
jgi:hypothetical protein